MLSTDDSTTFLLDARYRLMVPIGRGGMAEVWLGRERDRTVAVKQLRRPLIGDPIFEEVFSHEAEIGLWLDHPNIVRLTDVVGRADRVHAIVFEYVDGINLAQLARAARKHGIRFRAPVVAYVGAAILSALDHVHEKGIVHRDVSPQNVLVSREGEIKLIDFGVAIVDGTSPLEERSPARVYGKVAYMPIEQLVGQPLEPAADLWAAGVILHELTTGERLFRCRSTHEMVDAIAEKPIPLLATDPILSRVVSALTERSPYLRPSSGRDLLRELARIAAPEASRCFLAELVSRFR